MKINNVTKEQMKGLPYIVAVDFDGTLVEDKYPEIGEPIEITFDYMIHYLKLGAKLILWTCRAGKELQEAIAFCKTIGLVFDAVNKNIQEVIDLFGYDTRKVYANEYWDDKSSEMAV